MSNLNLTPFRSMFGQLMPWEEESSLVSTLLKNGVDIYETENEICVKANVAGVAADDIEVNFEKNVLWINAQSKKETEDKDKKFYNRSAWEYSYQISVPGLIDHAQEPEVGLKNGVLTVTFTKSEAYKPKKLTVKEK